MWPSTFGQAIRGPEAILDGEPSEEAAFGRRPRFPDNRAEGARQRGHELRLIAGARRVASIWREGPDDGIFYIWGELDI